VTGVQNEAVELLAAGSSFARYEIVRCIGVGGMGAVFEATHTLLRKRVALKTLHESLGRSESSRARFLREAETVARIRHSNVVDISDVGIERGIPFLVMEFLEGEDLAALLEREGKLSVQRAVDLLLPVVAGLCAVHRLGIVHRDIKPENIFLAVDSLGGLEPKLVDFGVSKDVEAQSGAGLPSHHTVAGTPYYMAPEQARGSAVLDGRADQYALGVVLYQCLSSARPFESASLLELIHLIDAGQYVALDTRCAELPHALCDVVRRAMSCRPMDRYPSTEAFGQALSAFASEDVAAACARDFAVERRSVATKGASGASYEHLSAPTMPEAPRALSGEPRALTAPTLSGVRARDSATPAGIASENISSRRAFWISALITLGLLLLGGALYWQRLAQPSVAVQHEPATLPVKPPAAASRVPAQVQSADPPAAQAVEPAPTQPAATTAPASSGAAPAPSRHTKPKREPKSDTPTPQTDIQLSR
jgi:serine/threonine protein kinase